MLSDPGIVIGPLPAADVMERWRELRASYNATGFWPVIVRSADEVGRFQERWEETREEFDEIDERASFDRAVLPGSPPGEDSPLSERDLAGILNLGEEAWIASFPCMEPAEVPARLLEGGDLCPSPEQHLATLRRWAASHGTEPLVVGQDTLILLVKPLKSLDEAERVAVEQSEYCGGGRDEAEEIAPHLVGLPVWFFWWD